MYIYMYTNVRSWKKFSLKKALFFLYPACLFFDITAPEYARR